MPRRRRQQRLKEIGEELSEVIHEESRADTQRLKPAQDLFIVDKKGRKPGSSSLAKQRREQKKQQRTSKLSYNEKKMVDRIVKSLESKETPSTEEASPVDATEVPVYNLWESSPSVKATEKANYGKKLQQWRSQSQRRKKGKEAPSVIVPAPGSSINPEARAYKEAVVSVAARQMAYEQELEEARRKVDPDSDDEDYGVDAEMEEEGSDDAMPSSEGKTSWQILEWSEMGVVKQKAMDAAREGSKLLADDAAADESDSEEEGEDADLVTLSANPPTAANKKSRVQRNREKRHKEMMYQHQQKKAEKQREKQLNNITFHLKSVAEEEKARQEEAARRQALGKAKLDDIRSGRDAERELRVLGAKRRRVVVPVPVPLPEELSDRMSMTRTMGYGGVLKDRMDSLLHRGRVEMGNPHKTKVKRRVKVKERFGAGVMPDAVLDIEEKLRHEEWDNRRKKPRHKRR